MGSKRELCEVNGDTNTRDKKQKQQIVNSVVKIELKKKKQSSKKKLRVEDEKERKKAGGMPIVKKVAEKTMKKGGVAMKKELPEWKIGVNPMGSHWCNVLPVRKSDGSFKFADLPSTRKFNPNLSPSQVLRMGSFGGGYFRSIKSSVTGKVYKDAWKELPTEWIKGMTPISQLASQKYVKSVNKFGVDCGAKVDKKDTHGLGYWEMKDWINEQDPYGWFMWYCRFFQGRRSDDDERQISRWEKFAGVKGRFRNNLIKKVLIAGASYDDPSVSPVVRQSLQHWGFELQQCHVDIYAKANKIKLEK